ncbi:MAG: glycosyltransferase family 87 protein [Cyanobacteriota bacterium]|nr:glycosyltransferase family 87 protein [Cyanobacteriota bacterium]
MAIAALLTVGVFGVGRELNIGHHDLTQFYTAGKLLLDGKSPYDPRAFAIEFQEVIRSIPDYRFLSNFQYSFLYPPQVGLFCMFFALFDYHGAIIAVDVMHLAIVAFLAIVSTWFVTRAQVTRPASTMPISKWLIPFLIIGNPFSAHLVWLGGMTFLPGVATIGGWYFAARDRAWLGGLILGFATIKPQLAILPVFWLLLERRWKVLGAMSLSSAGLAAYVLVLLGPIDTIRQWLLSAVLFETVPTAANRLGSREIMGIPSLLAALEIEVPGRLILLAFALVITFILWLMRKRFCPDDILGLLLSIQAMVVYGRHTEIVLLTPLLTSLWLHGAHRKVLCVAMAVAIPLLFLPQRFVIPLDVPVLIHWRTVIITLATIVLAILSLQQANRDDRISSL